MKIRTRIFLLFVAITACGFYFLVDWVQDDLRQRYLESLEEPLVDTANVLAAIVARDISQDPFPRATWRELFRAVYQRNLETRIYQLKKFFVDMRVYVTDNRGIVIFDSSEGRDEGKDYSRWNDVYRTLNGEYGARSSEEDPRYPNRSVIYVASPILVDGQLKGVLSVGKPTQNLDRFLRDAKQQVAVAGWVAALGMLLVVFVLYRWVSQPLQKLTDYVQAVKNGERVTLPQLGKNEIGLMGNALEEMRVALDGKAYVENYVQTLTHEIKSPLAAIRGAVELLQEDMSHDDRQRFLANIRQESGWAQHLVERMLQLVELENRTTLQKTEVIELGAVTRKAIEDVQLMAAAKSITIDAAIADIYEISGDAFLIQQAISNLLNNAIAFSKNSADIEVQVRKDGHHVVIKVLDRGSGIPEFALDKLFERFYSLQRPDTGKKSSGLGLSLVKEIAELHGGCIQVSNRPQGGVEALLTLPLI